MTTNARRYSVRFDGTELTSHTGLRSALWEWAIRRADLIGSWTDQTHRVTLIEVTEAPVDITIEAIDAADLPNIGSLTTEALAIERRRLTGEPRPVHLQTTASDVKCGAPMRDQSHPDGWDLGNTSAEGIGVTCPACLGQKDAR